MAKSNAVKLLNYTVLLSVVLVIIQISDAKKRQRVKR